MSGFKCCVFPVKHRGGGAITTPTQELHGDMGFPSVCGECVLLPLVNKEAASGLWQGRIEEGGNSKQR